MTLAYWLAVLLPVAGGLLGRLFAFLPAFSLWLAALVMCGGGVAGTGFSIWVLLHGVTPACAVSWMNTGMTLHLGCDAISAFFLLPISFLGMIATLFGAAYLGGHPSEDPAEEPANIGLFLGILLSGMTLVVTARDALTFLLAWEAMSLSAFFLVAWEDRLAESRSAAWTYLVATHFGTAFLMFFFLFLAGKANSLEFAALAVVPLSFRAQVALFAAAVIGFGAKAGFVPLHVWLPDAHPAAPSHVSAVMSGVMIKTGIYGLIRVIPFLGHLQEVWWGWTLLAIGLSSGIFGVLSALVQHDLKRLLAFSSIENIGIITIGLGLGLYGTAANLPTVAVLGMAGALLHVINHALFKGLMFLGAGVVAFTTGTREIDRLGGLYKRMPTAGSAILVGATAISGLPPLNGFLGEFLIYLAAFSGLMARKGFGLIPMFLTIAGLALIGGLATACFTKVFGIIFLGEPRSAAAAQTHAPPAVMTLALTILAIACATAALVIPHLLAHMTPLIAPFLRFDPAIVETELIRAADLLGGVLAGSTMLLGILALLTGARAWLLSGRIVGASPTWDCGYVAPNAHMAYTGSSFSQPLRDVFAPFLGTETHAPVLHGPFPVAGRFFSLQADRCRENFWAPLFQYASKGLFWWHWLQSGRLQAYVLYIALTLLAFMGWTLW